MLEYCMLSTLSSVHTIARLGIGTDWVHRPVAIRICLNCEFCWIYRCMYSNLQLLRNKLEGMMISG